MNFARIIALFHVSMAYHGGQNSGLYRLGCIVGRIYRPCRSEEYVATLDLDGYEDARALYGKYALALGGEQEGSGYHPCACCGSDMICEHWENGIARCDECREAECDPRNGCNCQESDLDPNEYTDAEGVNS